MTKDQPGAYSRRVWLCCGVLLICMILIKPLQDQINAHIDLTAQSLDVLYFSSPQAVKRMALGYDSLLADVYWMRAIQYYGRREEAAKRQVRYKNLAALLDITTTLDPNLLDAYRCGSTFLAERDPLGAGQPREAIRLLDKGIGAHPQEWRLYFDKGFVYFLFLEDPKIAGEVWLSASQLPTAPPWMKGLAAMAFSKGGAIETAKSLWQHQYQESNRADIKENARNHLVSIQVAEEIWTLEFLIEMFHAKTQSLPRSLNDLVDAGFLKDVPMDPLGTPYQYDPKTGGVELNTGSKVRYLEVPDYYREAFREKLADIYRQ